MRVLLIPSKNNYPNPEPDNTSFGQAIPYLAAALRQAGHEVFGLNMNYIWCHGSAPLTLERLLRKAINDSQPHLIGISGLAPDYLFVRDAIFFTRLLAPEVPIVIGGGLLTYDSEFVFNHLHPDFGVVGEGELAIVKLLEHLESRLPVEQVPSLVYWRNGQSAQTALDYPFDLDTLPFPEYDPFDFHTYLTLENQLNNFLVHTRQHPRVLPITVSRSCPFNCTFCAHSKKMRWRTRSIDNIMTEVAHFYDRYRFNILYIHDELMFIDAVKGEEFCQKILKLKKELGADFDWGCYLRVTDASTELLEAMKAAGCKYIGFGLESASDKILRSMKKGTTKEMIKKALSATQEVGMGLHGNFIFGDPAETPETIQETIEFYHQYCRELTIYMYHITPYPGSALFEDCLKRGILPDRETYYKTIAYNKRGCNMTAMTDEVLSRLTEPAMTDIFKAEKARIDSVEATEEPTPDVGAPFEMRRTVFRIQGGCPHCGAPLEYLYPLRPIPDSITPAIIHSCTRCHRKLLLDLNAHLEPFRELPDAYARFFSEEPYTSFYPFDARHHVPAGVATPLLIGDHAGFNLIRYGDSVHGVAQALGPLDITSLSTTRIELYRDKGAWFSASTEEEVRALIDMTNTREDRRQ